MNNWSSVIRRSLFVSVGATLLAALSPASQAAVVIGSGIRILRIWTYTDYGLGDVQISVDSPPATCPGGFWIRMSDAGAKSTLANLLSLQAQGVPVSIYAYDDSLWTGSASATCRLYTVAAS